MDLTFTLELLGLFLTLMVLLYLFIGDNALFRIVTYSFIGVAAGYVLVLIIFQVLLPRIFTLLSSGNLAAIGIGIIPFVLGLLLLFKLSPRFSAIGTLPMAIIVGIGAAVAIGGAIFGTLAGQIGGTIGLFSQNQGGNVVTRLLEGVFVLVGTISTLAYFQFSTRARAPIAEAEAPVRRQAGLEVLAKVGQIFIGITLGAMFAGVYTAAISALIERIGFVIGVIMKLL
jgi:hypothetical protein